MRARPLFERYAEKVDRRGPDECWPWLGATSGGYGTIGCDRKTLKAHRVGWELAHGPIPEGMQVLHSCDHPPCQNPAHWFLGTHQINMADRDAKGRQGDHRGTANGRAKLTERDLPVIKALVLWSGFSRTAVAREYGVSIFPVSALLRGITWRHVP